MKRTISILLLAAFLTAMLAGNAWGRPAAATKIKSVGSTQDGSTLFFAGELTSPKRGCLVGRKVSIFAHFHNGKTELIDVDTSSTHGAFVGGGDFSGADSAIAKVAQRNTGTKAHPKICRGTKKSLGAVMLGPI